MIRLLEVGFGTGLNAALTAADTDFPVHYISLELYPLDREFAKRLGYDTPLLSQVIDAPWDTTAEIRNGFILDKRISDFLNSPLPEDIDVVYFDAFAPEKQPEMWSEDAIRRVYDCMASNGVLTTYCAKGSVRRMLQNTGFVVERIAGPPGGKREILRATKP